MYMAIDQYGTTYHGLKHPRKDLLNRLGATHAEKIYQEDKKGHVYHVGYVIRGLWLTLYKVTPLQKEV